MRCSIKRSRALWDIKSKHGHWACIKANTLWHLVELLTEWPFRLHMATGESPDQLIQEYLP